MRLRMAALFNRKPHDMQEKDQVQANSRLDGQECWLKYRSAFGDKPDRYITLAESFRESGMATEEADVLNYATRLFPDSLQAALLHADLAVKEKNWLEASVRYSNIRKVFPNEESGYVFGGWTYWAAGKFDEADGILNIAIEKYPENPWAALHYAWSAQNRKDWAEAARRYGYVRTKFPDQSAGYIEGGWALREAGQAIEADDVLREAVEKFPDDPIAWFHYGRNASSLAKWQEAVSRWEACRSHLPNNPIWERELPRCHYDLEFHSIGTPDGSNAAFGSKPERTFSAKISAAEILSLFESLGDNCDFGLTQRYKGAEPLGLLRFGNVPNLQFLLDALNTEFFGVGLPENTSIEMSFNGEFLIRSTKGFAMMHSGIYNSADTNIDDVLRMMSPRLRYLVKRILSSLRNAEKIWVYKQYDRISDDEIHILHDTLRQYNNSNKLLCIRRPDKNHPEGSIEMYNDHVAVGYIEYTRDTLLESPPREDVWLQVCQLALEALPD